MEPKEGFGMCGEQGLQALGGKRRMGSVCSALREEGERGQHVQRELFNRTCGAGMSVADHINFRTATRTFGTDLWALFARRSAERGGAGYPRGTPDSVGRHR